MKARPIALFVSLVALSLFCASCDSTHPLSRADKAEPDARLLGIWKIQAAGIGRGGVFCRIDAGKHLPKGVYRGLWVQETPDKMGSRLVECVLFPTTINGNTYLNVGLFGKGEAEKLEESEFKPAMIQTYMLVQYQFEGDRLLIRGMNDMAKRRAIEAGQSRATPTAPATIG